MILDAMVTWAVRSAHILGAAVWLGGYAVMLLVIVPCLTRERNETVRRLGMGTARIISVAGGLTILAGLVLIWRSRGYSSLLLGEWGGVVISSFIVAFAMMGVGDSGLRPALRRLSPDDPATVEPVRRWAAVGLTLGVLGVLLMARAIYARS